MLLCLSSGAVTRRWCFARVQTSSSPHPQGDSVTLQPLQSNVGLAHPVVGHLHGHLDTLLSCIPAQWWGSPNSSYQQTMQTITHTFIHFRKVSRLNPPTIMIRILNALTKLQILNNMILQSDFNYYEIIYITSSRNCRINTYSLKPATAQKKSHFKTLSELGLLK